MQLRATITSGCVAAILVMLALPTEAQAVAHGTCRNASLPVATSSGSAVNKTVSGSLCTPQDWAEGEHQVDVLIPGTTYNRNYWNWPIDSALYSYVDKTLDAGRATFAYDRLGAGASSAVGSTTMTVQAEAYVLHQVIDWLRNVKQYAVVNSVGHSLGSVVAIQEAGTFDDADRVVFTSTLHNPGVLGLLNNANYYPAMLDPAFLGLLDIGYLTTLPGTRDNLFYYTTTADPAVIAYDEVQKDKFAGTSLVGSALILQGPAGSSVSTGITASVLTVIGANDTFICTGLDCTNESTLTTNEAPYYPNASSSTVLSIPETGHSLTLHPSADTSFTAINQWMTTH